MATEAIADMKTRIDYQNKVEEAIAGFIAGASIQAKPREAGQMFKRAYDKGRDEMLTYVKSQFESHDKGSPSLDLIIKSLPCKKT